MDDSQRDRLIFMGLVALDETAERVRKGRIEGTPALRVVLAMLYALCGKGRRHFYAYWRACVRAENPTAHGIHDRVMRSNEIGQSFAGICLALGIRHDAYLTDALSRARRERGHNGAWFDMHYPAFGKDAERARFADLLRATGEGRPG